MSRRKDDIGGFIQMSLACINIQETHKKSTRQLLYSGNNFGSNNKSDANFGEASINSAVSDEMFPLFGTETIRFDPVDLRNTYPVQAFGWKASIIALNNVSSIIIVLLTVTHPPHLKSSLFYYFDFTLENR